VPQQLVWVLVQEIGASSALMLPGINHSALINVASVCHIVQRVPHTLPAEHAHLGPQHNCWIICCMQY
jgi:hypothetical protein